MATILQLRRGTSAQHSSFTGAEGEITVDTSKFAVVVHDGSTAGGYELALADLSNTTAIALTSLSGGTGINYNNSTGEIAVDTSTIAERSWVTTQIQSKDALSELSGDSDDITEGSTNLYYTNARVKTLLTALDGSIIPAADVTYSLGSPSYQWADVYVGPGSLYVNGQKVLEENSGNIVVSADSNQNLVLQTSGSGDLELDPTGTGVVAVKGTLQLEDGVNVTNSAGNPISFGNNIKVNQITTKDNDTNLVLSGAGTGNVTVNDDLNVTGNLTVAGTTTTINSETVNLADNTIVLNSNFTSGVPTEDAGISVSRGGSTSVTLLWDEANDRWTVGGQSFVAGTFIGNLTGQVSTLSNHDTGDLAEGANLYFTDARARGAISVSGSLSYNSVSGVVSYTTPSTIASLSNHTTDGLSEGSTNQYFTTARARSSVSAGGDLSYDSSTGVVSYSTPSTIASLSNHDTDDLSEGSTNLYYTNARAQAAITAGTGVSVVAGQVSIGQSVATSASPTFNNLTLNGNLTVSGTTTTINTETVNIADNTIVLNSNYTGSTPSEDGGIEIERGTLANKSLLWDETNDRWTVGAETFVAGTFVGDVTGNVTGNVTGSSGTTSSISNHDTDDLAEGSTNQYFTTARARSSISASGSLSYNSSTGVVSYTTPSTIASLSNHNTDNLGEGSTNLYFTNARARSAISVSGDLSYNSSTGVVSFSETYSTAAELLTAIKTADGSGSGLDADLLDGQQGSYYRLNVYDASGNLLN